MSDPGVEKRTKTNKNNRLRGKFWERRVAGVLGATRNLDKSRPHTDIESETTVWEVKSTTSSLPAWIASAAIQLERASVESSKAPGGIVKVWTNRGGNARAFLITELDLKEGDK